jgi:hypothetical protein
VQHGCGGRADRQQRQRLEDGETLGGVTLLVHGDDPLDPVGRAGERGEQQRPSGPATGPVWTPG